MNKLLLELHLNAKNSAKLVFKSARQFLRLKKLDNAMPLVANLHQLSKAIAVGATQDCGYELKDINGKEWLLECRFKKGIVDLQLWLQNLTLNDRLENLFDWRGTAHEFVRAVNGMIARMPKYRFVFW